MKRLLITVSLFAACALMTAQQAVARPEMSREEARQKLDTRGKRTLLINNVAFLDSSDPVVTTGTLLQISFRKAKGETAIVIDQDMNEAGDIVMDTLVVFNSYRAPTYYLHFLQTTGVATGDRSGAVGYLQLGVLKRNESKLMKFVGVAAQAVYEPWRAGPVIRVEVMDNIGLNAGWMFDDDDDNDDEGFYLSVDYFFKLLEDLNLKPAL